MIQATQEAIHRLGGLRFYRRAGAVLILLLTLVAFRHMALLLVSFIIFTHALSWLGGRVARILGTSRKRGVAVVLLVLLFVIGLLLFLSVRMGNHAYTRFTGGQPITIRVQELQTDLLHRVPTWIPIDDIKEKAPELLAPAVVYVRATGQILLQLLIGLILSAIYLINPGEVDALVASAREESLPGCLRRYFGYLAEAIVITIQLQLLVALVNTVLTLPVLLTLRLPHIATFTAVIFFCSLVPVVGNLMSGAVLIAASYTYRGLIGVALFLITTVILHKIEAYYLNPRLTSRHVKLPALVLIISIIVFEHVFGIIGLFLSFPSLYVGIKVFQDFRPPAPPDVHLELPVPDQKG